MLTISHLQIKESLFLCISSFNKTEFLYIRIITCYYSTKNVLKNGFQNVKKNVLKCVKIPPSLLCFQITPDSFC